MKATLTVVAVLSFVCCVSALPATSKQIDDGIEFINPRKPYSGQPIVDTGVVNDDEPSYNPLGGLFDNIQGLMNRVRQQMNDLLNRFPTIGGTNSSDFPTIGEFPQFNFDLGKGNTTSVTKIIDGHKVIINQTEYQKDDELGSSFFKVRVIDVQPQDESTERDQDKIPSRSTAPKDRESLENTVENEIIKNKEVGTHTAPEKLVRAN